MKILKRFAALPPILCLAWISAGCGTHSPKTVRAHEPSISDTGHADSGIIRFIGPPTDRRLLVTPDHVEEYNRLIKDYGDRLPMPVTRTNAGVTATPSNLFLMTIPAERDREVMTLLANNPPAQPWWKKYWRPLLISVCAVFVVFWVGRKTVDTNCSN